MNGVCKCTPTAPVKEPRSTFGSGWTQPARAARVIPSSPPLPRTSHAWGGRGDGHHRLGQVHTRAALQRPPRHFCGSRGCMHRCKAKTPIAGGGRAWMHGTVHARGAVPAEAIGVFGPASRAWCLLHEGLLFCLPWDRGKNDRGMSTRLVKGKGLQLAWHRKETGKSETRNKINQTNGYGEYIMRGSAEHPGSGQHCCSLQGLSPVRSDGFGADEARGSVARRAWQCSLSSPACCAPGEWGARCTSECGALAARMGARVKGGQKLDGEKTEGLYINQWCHLPWRIMVPSTPFSPKRPNLPRTQREFDMKRAERGWSYLMSKGDGKDGAA